VSRVVKLIFAVLLIAVGASLTSSMLRPEAPSGPCAVLNRAVALPDVPEASGLAISRRHPGVIWSHNDSGNEPVLFAFDRDGRPRARIRVPAGMRDWEDISAAPCSGGACLYLADIGDNRSVRPEISIYRVLEPSLSDAQTAAPERFRVKYADGPHNAEAMFIAGTDLFIITRDRTGRLYRSAIPKDGQHEMTMTRVGELGLSAVTDAEASLDGRSVVVRTSRVAAFYRIADLLEGRIAEYFRLAIDGLREAQGEGVAIDGNTLFFASESRWTSSGGLVTVRCADTAINP
jgi:hypothetical protein